MTDDGAEDPPGFRIQASLFAGVGAFFLLIAIIYGGVSTEPAGFTMLVLAGGLALLTAAYLGIAKRPPRAAPDEPEARESTEADEPWFPHASVWPFVVGLGAVIVANGILIGLWMLLPAGLVLAGAVIGFCRQSRLRA